MDKLFEEVESPRLILFLHGWQNSLVVEIYERIILFVVGRVRFGQRLSCFEAFDVIRIHNFSLKLCYYVSEHLKKNSLLTKPNP